VPGSESISSELVVAYEPFSRAEELRTLRTQLLMPLVSRGQTADAGGRRPVRRRRSYVTANLAIVSRSSANERYSFDLLQSYGAAGSAGFFISTSCAIRRDAEASDPDGAIRPRRSARPVAPSGIRSRLGPVKEPGADSRPRSVGFCQDGVAFVRRACEKTIARLAVT